MSLAPPRLLFIPVSGPSGMGEFSRTLAMAHAALQRRADAVIHFALSREAPYAANVPFPAALLPSSPTFHSAQIVALIREFQPTTVIFDNAGRTVQLRAARDSGARVVFVSARARQRRKAFRIRWMRLIDEHWIAYPRLLAGDIGVLERMKLRMLNRPQLRFLDPLLPAADEARATNLFLRTGVRTNDYVAVVPGGGTEHAGTAGALEAIAEAAARIAAGGVPTVVVGLDRQRKAGLPGLHLAARMPLPDLVELLRGARLVVSNGGYTMLQALACDRPCIAVPLVKDQLQRIDRCVAAGIAIRGEPDAQALSSAAFDLLNDATRLEALRRARARAQIRNGAEAVALALIGSGG